MNVREIRKRYAAMRVEKRKDVQAETFATEHGIQLDVLRAIASGASNPQLLAEVAIEEYERGVDR